MSKGLADDAKKIEWRSPEELKNEFGVEFHPGTVSGTCLNKLTSLSPSPRSIRQPKQYSHLQARHSHTTILFLLPAGGQGKFPSMVKT